ncbi:hypothetical protein LCGC14_1228510 [marine sediment metagenome]|uniref:4-vinyl reductase 4VR domain-containing protein n=1 Tax=marine sediment metagenome TaxID=412755 RepID=A0A0F9PDK5_9ZZZZ
MLVEVEKINDKIHNEVSNIDSFKGLEIICEAFVYKILKVFGENSLLSILYQVGAGPGEVIADKIKEIYNRDEFEVLELFEILLNELKELYSIKIREIQEEPDRIRIIIENRCYLRSLIEDREKLEFGTAFCRINKGYFETAINILLKDKIKKIEINFIENDEENEFCLEELIFTL